MRSQVASFVTWDALSRAGRARRAALILAIGAVHLLAILWLATRPPNSLPISGTALSIIDITAPLPGQPASAPPKPPEPVPEPVPMPVLMPSPLPAPVPDAPATPLAPGIAGSSGLVGSGCTLANVAGEAIRASAAAMAELDALPREVRTEADAVMLWDGNWQGPAAARASAAQPTTGAATQVLSGATRQVMEQLVRAASSECRDAPRLGPQFIAVPGPTRTIMVVIGSGAWRWGDLIRPEELCSTVAGAMCPARLARPAQ